MAFKLFLKTIFQAATNDCSQSTPEAKSIWNLPGYPSHCQGSPWTGVWIIAPSQLPSWIVRTALSITHLRGGWRRLRNQSLFKGRPWFLLQGPAEELICFASAWQSSILSTATFFWSEIATLFDLKPLAFLVLVQKSPKGLISPTLVLHVCPSPLFCVSSDFIWTSFVPYYSGFCLSA